MEFQLYVYIKIILLQLQLTISTNYENVVYLNIFLFIIWVDYLILFLVTAPSTLLAANIHWFTSHFQVKVTRGWPQGQYTFLLDQSSVASQNEWTIIVAHRNKIFFTFKPSNVDRARHQVEKCILWGGSKGRSTISKLQMTELTYEEY